MKFEEITTKNLILRKLTPEVYQHLFSSFSDDAIKTFLGIGTETDYLKEKEKFEKGMSTYNKSFVNFQIIDKASNEVIGACGFHTWYLDHARAEIGYALKSDTFKGKGIMTEAFRKVIAYGFNEMKLNRVEAFIGTNNIPSLKLVAKFGFVQEGHLRQHYFKNKVMEDSLVFSLLKSEYHP